MYFFSYLGEAIKCHQCTSYTDAGCGDPFGLTTEAAACPADTAEKVHFCRKIFQNMNSEIGDCDKTRAVFLFFSDYIHHQIVCLFVQGCGLRHWAAAPYWLKAISVWYKAGLPQTAPMIFVSYFQPDSIGDSDASAASSGCQLELTYWT